MKKFSNDHATIVKKELITLLKDFCISLEEDLLMEIMSNIIKEKNEFSRIPIFECIITLKEHKGLPKMQEFILNIINNLSNDDCWRVRYTVAERLHEVLTFSSFSSQLKLLCVDIFARYLEDNEAEVRKIICLNLDKFCENLGKDDLIDKIIKKFKNMEKDSQTFVKSIKFPYF